MFIKSNVTFVAVDGMLDLQYGDVINETMPQTRLDRRILSFYVTCYMLLRLTSVSRLEHSCYSARYRAPMPGLGPHDTDSIPGRVNHLTAHSLLGFSITDTLSYSHVFRKEMGISTFLPVFVCMCGGKKNQSVDPTGLNLDDVSIKTTKSTLRTLANALLRQRVNNKDRIIITCLLCGADSFMKRLPACS
jgi:hypothetical protein